MTLEGNRKFYLACFFALTAAVALFAGRLDQGGFVTLATLILSIFAAGNIVDKKLGGKG